MNRTGNLYPRIWDFENLLAAAHRARRGKKNRPDVAAFHFHQEAELFRLQEELRAKTYQPGPYRAFYIRDPKRRLISAAPYRDRVVHHALCQMIEPVFDRGFIHTSYANRAGKGTHAALDECTRLARRYRYALKCDIEKYFPSIDHAILLGRIARKIKCRDTLWLIETIIAHSNPQEEVIRYFPGDDLFTPLDRRRGIPIGNLTSQFFANVYLDGFDHFVKQDLRHPAYLRFADDFLIFGDSAEELRGMLGPLREHLDSLRLCLHPRKCHVVPVRCGVPFLGWQVYPDHRRLRRTTGVRIQRRLGALAHAHREGRIGWDRLRASVMSCIGHLKHGDTWGLRRRLFNKLAAKAGHPHPASRVQDCGAGLRPASHPAAARVQA
jgi:retron-type reverse transcriptase